ncbi:hypothetical protein CDD83_10173 [Cordyceps sp. RAO-2017]|nr:hypothetical protein CDD83_10173 [Cordyceps sp. RAO-2017]
MPRLPPWLFRQAKQQSPNLAALVPACRSLESARNELRWIQEHVRKTVQARRRQTLAKLCRDRGRGVPLQYILGSQPFGHLDIRCRPGVLIPRPETEAYTCHLVDLVQRGRLSVPKHGRALRMVDLCTGTGCIPLLLFSLLQQCFPALHVLGVDIAPEAVKLARENIDRNIRLGHIGRPAPEQDLRILKGDIFDDEDLRALARSPCDILVSNPPYIAETVWNYGRGQLGYSVRKYEPQLALVPGGHLPIPEGWEREDVFYSRLLSIAALLRPTVLLMELGDEAQARRIMRLLPHDSNIQGSTVELWRDFPDLTPVKGEATRLDLETACGPALSVPIKGTGEVRCLFLEKFWPEY